MLRRAVITLLVVVSSTLAAGAAQADVSVTSFSLTPSTTKAGSNPDVTVSARFSSADNDTPKDATIALAAGLLANPDVATVCSDSDFASDNCPGSSHIGQGSISGTAYGGAVTIPATIYRVTTQGAEVARIGIIADFFDTPIPITAPVQVRSTPDVGLDIPIDGIPNQIAGGSVQITGLTLTLNGTVDGQSFTRIPTSCSSADTTLTIDSYGNPSTGVTAESSFTPTACDALHFAPKLTASVTPDSGDSGIALSTDIRQQAGEAATRQVKIALPASISPRLAALSSGGTVGTATVTTPLLSAPLRGHLVFSASGLDAVFGPPLNLTIRGTPTITGGALSTTFSSLPDVPITDLKVNFAGGPNSLLMESTAACGDIIGNLGAYNGATAHLVAPLACHEGKPSAQLKRGHGKHRKLTIMVLAGQNAPAIHSVHVKLPSGLHVARLTIASGGRGATIVIKGHALRAHRHPHHTVTLVLTVTDASGTQTQLQLTKLL